MKSVKEQAVKLATALIKKIDFSEFTGKRAFAAWDEITSRVKGCATVTDTLEGFVDKFCKKYGILSISDKNIALLCRSDETTKKAILEELKNNTQIIVLEVQLAREAEKNEKKAGK